MIEKRCVRDVAYRVICGGLYPDHATIARFRARHEQALGGLFSQVLRLLAAEGMVALGVLSLDGTKLAGNAAQRRTGRCRRSRRSWPRPRRRHVSGQLYTRIRNRLSVTHGTRPVSWTDSASRLGSSSTSRLRRLPPKP